MKTRTLGWVQLLIGVFTLLLFIYSFYSTSSAYNAGYFVGSNLTGILFGIFALLTGIHTLSSKE